MADGGMSFSDYVLSRYISWQDGVGDTVSGDEVMRLVEDMLLSPYRYGVLNGHKQVEVYGVGKYSVLDKGDSVKLSFKPSGGAVRHVHDLLSLASVSEGEGGSFVLPSLERLREVFTNLE